MSQHQAFHASMVGIYSQAKELGYTANYFLRMVEDMGGVAAAKKLVNDSSPSEGFTRLWDMRRLDLSVEAHVIKPEWSPLFSPAERLLARKRLEQYGYYPGLAGRPRGHA